MTNITYDMVNLKNQVKIMKYQSLLRLLNAIDETQIENASNMYDEWQLIKTLERHF